MSRYLFVALSLVASADSFSSGKLSWLEESNAKIRQLTQQEAPEWLKPGAPMAQQIEAAKDISDRGGAAVRNQIGASADESNASSKKYASPMILVSTSIPRNVMKGIIEEAIETESTLVFRGVPKGKNFMYLNKYISSFGFKDVPSVVLDPPLFSRLSTVDVPSVAYPVDDGSKFAIVKGIVNIDWMKRKIKSRKNQNDLYFGVQGTTWEVSEPDLIEEMQRRAASIDWEKKKKAAIDNFWVKQNYTDLPETKQSGVFSFDPTMVLDKDINGKNGVSLPAGTSINPLARMAMTKRYIFFDASKPGQVATALKIHNETIASGRSTSLIATRVDVDKSWDGFSNLTAKFSQPVFILNSMIRDRFRLRSVPSYADAVGLEMRITEVLPTKGGSK